MMTWSSMWLFALLALGEASKERRQDNDDVPIKDYRRRLLESGMFDNRIDMKG